MEVGRFCTEDRVSLERILCSAMEASVVETVLVAEKYAIWLLLEMGMLLKDMGALQKGANINEKVITTMVGRVKPEVEPENKDYGETDDDDDDEDYDDDDSDEEEDEDDVDDQDDDGGEDDLSGDEDSEGDDDNNDDPTANGEGGSEEEDDDDSDDDGEDEDDDEDEDEDEDDDEDETPQPPFKKMTEGKFYVVSEGHIPGIYDSWEDCSQHVLGYPGSVYKSYLTREEAKSAFKR